jgi:prepilin-type N-terminal cleavage/methylation domain-containing protein/prepilin-type processing-associated H-X9-DG protein
MKIPVHRQLASPENAGRGKPAFTLVELLVVIAIIGILAAMLMPVLARAKETGKRIGCLNNVRQLGIALHAYVDDSGGFYPERATQNRWPQQIADNYGRNVNLLLCPSDGPNPATWETDAVNFPADAAPRSYIFNGWNDYFAQALNISPDDWSALEQAMFANRMKETFVRYPSETVAFGEKRTEEKDYYMDIFEPDSSGIVGNDIVGIVEQSRHDSHGPGSGSGGSNYAMVDGSARFMKFPTSLDPLNLWCYDGPSRAAYAISY